MRSDDLEPLALDHLVVEDVDALLGDPLSPPGVADHREEVKEAA